MVDDVTHSSTCVRCETWIWIAKRSDRKLSIIVLAMNTSTAAVNNTSMDTTVYTITSEETTTSCMTTAMITSGITTNCIHSKYPEEWYGFHHHNSSDHKNKSSWAWPQEARHG